MLDTIISALKQELTNMAEKAEDGGVFDVRLRGWQGNSLHLEVIKGGETYGVWVTISAEKY